ncbi:putative aryl-alcohol dehydrogenase [Moniliophthora roreri]|nr:putative aryl-alcohol dehydrogenase [Moniliophthora roreri]
MSAFAPVPPPPTKLGVYLTLASRAGFHVSPLCFGAMSIGDKWNSFMGSMDKESSFKLLDVYLEMGDNFIDTANKYLKKLRTTYIDLFYVHWWDWDTTIEEVMDGLHNLVVQGKVLYLGVSDTPAWIVAKAKQYAKDHGKTPFVVYQGEWNIMQRSFERDIIPMARDFGMALAPWGVLAGGKLRTDAEEQARLQSGEEGRKTWGDWKRNDAQVKVSRALGKVAGEVAIAYIMQKTTHVFPIIGGRKVEQLQQNLEALDITFSAEQIKFLESQVEFDIGFPMTMIGDGSDVFIGFTRWRERSRRFLIRKLWEHLNCSM